MQIEILRLNHRIARDKRISTHVSLVSRAFLASKIYYTGQKDSEMESSVNKITKKFGGNFKIQHINNEIKLIEEKTKEGYKIIHLTVYGISIKDKLKEIKKQKKLLIIVGGEKFEPIIYKLSNYNISITNQPHSEVAALAVLMYELFGINEDFNDAEVKIIPSEKGKTVKSLK